MLKLYYFQGACSLVPHIALEWTGLPYEIERVAHGEDRDPEFLKLNPLGSVPCLVDGDLVLTQNVAILEYLNDARPQAKLLGGESAKEKSPARQWLSLLNSDLHPQFSNLFRIPRIFGDDARGEELRKSSLERIGAIYDIVDKRLREADRLAGPRTVADAYLHVTLGWCDGLGIDLSDRPGILKFRESFAKDEGVVKAERMEREDGKA